MCWNFGSYRDESERYNFWHQEEELLALKRLLFVVPKTTRYLLQMVPYDKAFEHENYGQNDWKEGFSENSAELCYTTLFLNLTNLVPIDVEFVLVCFVIVEIQVCFLA